MIEDARLARVCVMYTLSLRLASLMCECTNSPICVCTVSLDPFLCVHTRFARVYVRKMFNIGHLFKIRAPLSAHTRSHLVRVYSLLFVGVLSAVVGCVLDMHYTRFGGLLTALIGAISFAAARSSSGNKSNLNGIILFLLGTGLEGMSLSPIIFTASVYYPKALTTAILSSVAIFGSFSLAAIFAKRREFLFLGGILATGASFLCMASITNIFIRSQFIMDIQVYLGLAMFVGYVLVDTQMMIERFETGQYMRNNFVRPACDLFMDLIAVFVRILIILMRKQEKKRYSNTSNDRRYR